MNANKYKHYTAEQLVDAIQDFAFAAARHGIAAIATKDFPLLLTEIDSRLYSYETGLPLGSG